MQGPVSTSVAGAVERRFDQRVRDREAARGAERRGREDGAEHAAVGVDQGPPELPLRTEPRRLAIARRIGPRP